MIQLKIRCGETYDFNMIKSITDNGNGTVEIIGNFKPRGRYKHVIIFKMTIENWDEIVKIFPIIQKPYYCKKCKVIHKDGKKYNEHKEYYKTEDLIPCDRILKADVDKLPDIGKRQYNRLLERLELNPDRREMYYKEINKLLIFEGVNEEEVK